MLNELVFSATRSRVLLWRADGAEVLRFQFLLLEIDPLPAGLVVFRGGVRFGCEKKTIIGMNWHSHHHAHERAGVSYLQNSCYVLSRTRKRQSSFFVPQGARVCFLVGSGLANTRWMHISQGSVETRGLRSQDYGVTSCDDP